ncbi:MAG: DNA modification methylase [Planctomycetes bacterium]|nr:DNA modification methylase [Planctomycetota bacterium]
MRRQQAWLFPDAEQEPSVGPEASTTFVNNMTLPVHRWFRYSAGFSAKWVEQVIRDFRGGDPVRVFDPFAGSSTTLLAAEAEGVESWGIDAHPFVYRIGRAKLQWRSDPEAYLRMIHEIRRVAATITPQTTGYPPLISKCYDEATLADLDALRQAFDFVKDDSPASELAWLTILSILRKTSHAGTAQWTYVLPKKQKKCPQNASAAFDECSRMIYHDMLSGQSLDGPRACLLQGDARNCQDIAQHGANLVITSPPYPNNYDYADATRLEMSFMGEIRGWGDLQESVRRHLVRSCSQHVPERAVDLEAVLASPELDPIREDAARVCHQLAEIRLTKGGKKTYHLMVACYFRDLAQVWQALHQVCSEQARVCFVIGDSAPYGVYVPVIPWLGALAIAAGFRSYRFEQTRARNIKWKNRKHRVPLQEGRLWVER